MTRILLANLVLLITSACAVKNVKDSYRLEEASYKGLVIFSLSVTGSKAVYIAYRRKGYDEQNVIYVDSYGAKGFRANYDWKDPVGRLVYIELSAGEYEFHGWNPSYCGWEYECLPLSKPIGFSVKQGTAHYIGNIHFSILSADRAYKYEINDEFDRDISLLTNRLINVPGGQVLRMVSENQGQVDK